MDLCIYYLSSLFASRTTGFQNFFSSWNRNRLIFTLLISWNPTSGWMVGARLTPLLYSFCYELEIALQTLHLHKSFSILPCWLSAPMHFYLSVAPDTRIFQQIAKFFTPILLWVWDVRHFLYLILFDPHAFAIDCQYSASKLPSLLVFPMISVDFTPPP